MKRMAVILTVLGSLLPVAAADGQEGNTPQSQDAGKLGGFGLAAGIGIIHLDDPDVSDVTLENGKVRIGSEDTTINGFWLETHYTFGRGAYVDKQIAGKKVPVPRAFYHGPFLGVQVTDGEDFLKTVGLGYMISLKRKRGDENDKGAFNLGLGLCNTRITSLADGVVENQALPEGMETPRTKKRNVRGGMLVLSFTFL